MSPSEGAEDGSHRSCVVHHSFLPPMSMAVKAASFSASFFILVILSNLAQKHTSISTHADCPSTLLLVSGEIVGIYSRTERRAVDPDDQVVCLPSEAHPEVATLSRRSDEHNRHSINILFIEHTHCRDVPEEKGEDIV